MSRKSRGQTIRANQKLYRSKLKTAKLIFDPLPGIAILVVSLIGMMMSAIFISMRFRCNPISVEDAVSYEGTLVDLNVYYGYRSGGVSDIDLIFADHHTYRIDTSLTNKSLQNDLEKLCGQQISLLYNSRADSVIEITQDEMVLLSFDYAQDRLLMMGRMSCAVGVVFAAVSIGLMIWSIRLLARVMREKRQYFAELEEWKKSVDWEEIQ